MGLIIEKSKDGRPLCHFCKKNIGIHAFPANPGFVPVCHKCYVELTTPITKIDLKRMLPDIIKKAIKEYDNSKRND